MNVTAAPASFPLVFVRVGIGDNFTNVLTVPPEDLGEGTFVISEFLAGTTISTGDEIRFAIAPVTVDMEYSITDYTMEIPASLSTAYDFDIDTVGTHFPGVGGVVEIDFTDAVSEDGQLLNVAVNGTWRTDGGIRIQLIPGLVNPTIAEDIEAIGNSDLRDDVTVTRNGDIITITAADDGFTFWMARATTASSFGWDNDWIVLPVVRVDGVVVSSAENDPILDVGSRNRLVGSFPQTASTGELAATHFADAIETQYPAVTVSEPEFIQGVGGTLEIDLENVASTGSVSGTLYGDWRTDAGEFFRVTGAADANTIATEIFDEANSSLRSDVTVTRSGNTITITSTAEGFRFWVNSSQAAFFNQFRFDDAFDPLPIIRVDGQVIDSSHEAPRVTAGSFNRWQIRANTGILDDVADASLTITQNTGSETDPAEFFISDGAAPLDASHSTYMVHDYSNTQVTTFTSSVISDTSSDLVSVINQITAAVNNNTETPIDFTAADDPDGNRIIFTAAESGMVSGNFRVTVDHGDNESPGNIEFTFNSDASVQSGSVTGPVIEAVEPGVSATTHTLTLFPDEVNSTPKTATETAAEISRLLSPAAWENLFSGDTVRFTSIFTRPISGLWDFSVSDLGTSGSTISNDDLVVVREITGAEGLGNFIYASGRYEDGDYSVPSPGADSTHIAYLPVTWENEEPEVSTLYTDYDFRRTEGPPGEDAVTAYVEFRMRPSDVPASSLSAASSVDPSTWDFATSGSTFRNSAGDEKAIVIFVQIGGELVTPIQHASYSYSWQKGNNIFTPTVVGASRFSRWIPVVPDDILGEEQFSYSVDNISN